MQHIGKVYQLVPPDINRDEFWYQFERLRRVMMEDGKINFFFEEEPPGSCRWGIYERLPPSSDRPDRKHIGELHDGRIYTWSKRLEDFLDNYPPL